MPNATALITGANKGIGLAVARQLGERGYSVWLGCRDETRGESVAAGLREAGVDARALSLDVADDASVRAAADRLARETDKLDVLVKELLAEGIKVNAADSGFTATDLNAHTRYRSVEQAAAIAVELATLGFMGPTGGFFHDDHAGQSRHRW